MCTYDWLVDNAKGIMKMTRKVLGQRLFKATMRATIYGQFVGGEGKHDIQGKKRLNPNKCNARRLLRRFERDNCLDRYLFPIRVGFGGLCTWLGRDNVSLGTDFP